jgi:hypothetical protein
MEGFDYGESLDLCRSIDRYLSHCLGSWVLYEKEGLGEQYRLTHCPLGRGADAHRIGSFSRFCFTPLISGGIHFLAGSAQAWFGLFLSKY